MARLTAEDLAEIESRSGKPPFGDSGWAPTIGDVVSRYNADTYRLLAEVRALTAERDAARKEHADNEEATEHLSCTDVDLIWKLLDERKEADHRGLCPAEIETLGSLWERLSTQFYGRVPGVAAETERCATIAESWADNYPEDVFPPIGTTGQPATIDQIAAQASRHSAKQIAAKIREKAQE